MLFRKLRSREQVSPDEQKLAELVAKSNRLILRTTTIFPFDFFPDDLIISENQVDLVFRQFFFSEHIETVLIRDIQQVSVETSVIFATLTISLLKPQSIPFTLPYLLRHEAILARRVIYGLMAVTKEGIDVASVELPKLVRHLEMIGRDYD